MTLKQPEGMIFGIPNCGVVAVAACAGVPYETAKRAVFMELSPARQKAWKGRTYSRERVGALTKLGVGLAETFEARPRQRMSLKKWAETALPGTTYMVNVTGHVVTYRDGVVMDQGGLHTVATARVARKFVTIAHRILN